jgi:hypothetical protein
MNKQNETDKIIRLLEERLLQTTVRHSVNDIDELLADEFIEFGSSGESSIKTGDRSSTNGSAATTFFNRLQNN